MLEILLLMTIEKIKIKIKMILVDTKSQSKKREGLVKMIINPIIAK